MKCFCGNNSFMEFEKKKLTCLHCKKVFISIWIKGEHDGISHEELAPILDDVVDYTNHSEDWSNADYEEELSRDRQNRFDEGLYDPTEE